MLEQGKISLGSNNNRIRIPRLIKLVLWARRLQTALEVVLERMILTSSLPNATTKS